jgi:hypothetical protein
MPKKYLSCVKKVQAKGIGNPYSICRVSTGFYGSTHHKHKLKGGNKKL